MPGPVNPYFLSTRPASGSDRLVKIKLRVCYGRVTPKRDALSGFMSISGVELSYR
jgi:hypothetical protein